MNVITCWSLVSLRTVAFPFVSETTKPNRSSSTPAADADGDADPLTAGALAVGSVGDALGAVFAVVHAMRAVPRKASARGTS
jgi:hypothetical protein